jgi:hypothetical protein
MIAISSILLIILGLYGSYSGWNELKFTKYKLGNCIMFLGLILWIVFIIKIIITI